MASTSAPASCVRPSGNAPAISAWNASSPRRSTNSSSEAPMGSLVYLLTAFFFLAGLGGLAYSFVAPSGETSKKRMAAAAGPMASGAGRAAPDANQQRRKNVQSLLKDLEKQQKAKKQRP